MGSLHCRTDIQLADGKALLLKCVSSYVMKMHESATSEGLYCNDVTGYQAANSFLHNVKPLEPEMIFQLSNLKVCWTDKMTLLFRAPFPNQTEGNKIYGMYLQRPVAEEDSPFLNGSDATGRLGTNRRPMTQTKYFYQYLTIHHPHRRPSQLRHAEQESMPSSIRFFSQVATLTADHWSSADSITAYFSRDGHKEYFVDTIVSYVKSLNDILHPWTICVVDGGVAYLTAMSIEHLYLLSPLQRSILSDIMGALTARRDAENDYHHSLSINWQKYGVLLGKPGTGKSQVLIRAIDHALQNEFRVLVAAPVALLAQSYSSIFAADIDTDTSHGAFNIPIHGAPSDDVNYAISKYDIIVVDEASMISQPTFEVMAATFNCLNVRPVVLFAGDKCQQQSLQTVRSYNRHHVHHK